MSLRVARFLYRWRLWLSAMAVAGAVVLAPRAQIQNIDNDLTAWFSEDDPVYQDYQRFQTEFGGTRNLLIAVRAPSRERLFSAEGFDFLTKVSEDLERVQAVQRISSLATATVVDALPAEGDEPGGIDVRRLVDDLDTSGPDAVGTRAVEDDFFRGDLVSGDGTVAAIVVFFDESRIDDLRAEVLTEIRDVVTAALPAGFDVFYNGSLEITEWYNRVTLDNQTKFTPPIFVFTLGALFLMFRSWQKTLLIFGAILVSLLWTLGLYDLFGLSYNVLSSMIVPLVVVLAIADDVHVLQHYGLARRTQSHEQAFVGTVTHLLAPIAGASITTALGMLSLATSQVVAVREFGIGAAMGVMIDCAISIVLVPTLLGWVRPDVRAIPQESWFLEPLRRVAVFSTRNARTVVAVGAVVAVLAGIGASKLRVDTNHINFFAEHHELSRSAAVMDTQLSGIYTFQILLEGEPESMRQPDVLGRIDRLSSSLEALPYVKKVTSLADYVKRVHRELNDGRAEADVIPATAPEIAQELLVFGLGDEGRAELDRVVASDYSRAQITIKLASMSSDLVFQQVQEADRLAQSLFAGSGVVPTVTGSGRLFSTLDHYLVRSQLSSFGTAFLTIFTVIFLIFRSWRFGLLSIAPNLFPVLTVFGAMGWLDISLNVATVMVASVALGVVDDDTIHFISRYRKECRRGADTDAAILTATREEGRAALTTAIVNCCAFSVLMLSEYRPTAWFGGLLALTMVVAFLAEVFVLPATIKLFPRLFEAGNVRRAEGIVVAGLLVMLGAPAMATAAPQDSKVTASGDVSVTALTLPRQPPGGSTNELRGRLRVEATADPNSWLRLKFDGTVDGLVADRQGRVTDVVVRAREAWVEARGARADVRVGYGRLVWGRLDEIMPSDVLNPIDLSRFFLEGRNEARLPIAFARARVFLSDRASIEGIVSAPGRRGRFDALDEPSSPFNLFNDLVLPATAGRLDRQEPGPSWETLQGGGRLSATVGRVDTSVSVYRGSESFGVVTFEPVLLSPGALVVGQLVERYPRFTMVATDAETVVGPWAIRGEVAYFPERTLGDAGLDASGRALDAGIGVDRSAGDYRVFTSVVWHRDWTTEGPAQVNNDLSLIGSVERRFGRDRYLVRMFGVANPVDDSAFVRAVAAWSVRDNVLLEGSAGLFLGDSNGTDMLSRLRDRDFAFARLRWFF